LIPSASGYLLIRWHKPCSGISEVALPRRPPTASAASALHLPSMCVTNWGQHPIRSFDGGNCLVGLESTIISLVDDRPVLLRPGGISLLELSEVIGAEVALLKQPEPALRAPGSHASHYEPLTAPGSHNLWREPPGCCQEPVRRRTESCPALPYRTIFQPASQQAHCFCQSPQLPTVAQYTPHCASLMPPATT
jgi:hypothetical protein